LKQIFIFFFLTIIIACTSDNEQDYFNLDDDCDTDNLYYMANDEARSISAIIANKCATCHSESNMSQGGWVSLETYAQLIDTSSYSLYDVTVGPNASMPKEGAPQLTDCEKLKIESWIDNGFAYEE